MDWPESTEPILTVLPRGLKHDGGKLGGAKLERPQSADLDVEIRQPRHDRLRARSRRRAQRARPRGAHALSQRRPISAPRDKALPGVHAGLWAQYALDNAASVAEALDLLSKIQIMPVETHGHKANVHLAIEDASGDSAIIEYIDGKPVVHHGRDYRVMTNDPSYDQQLDLLRRRISRKPSSDMPLPGNVNPRDRFQRAAYYLSMLPTPKTEREGVASMLAIMRNVSVPFGAPYKSFGVYNTEYRTVADTTNKLYFFELTTSPNVIWTDLKNARLPPRRAGPDAQSGLDRPRRRRHGRLQARPRALLTAVEASLCDIKWH